MDCPSPVPCVSIGTQCADVSLPVRLQPRATVGAPVTQCCGTPSVSFRPCPVGGSCGYCLTITQTVCIEIPITYSATAEAGEAAFSCKNPPGGR